MKDGGQHSRKSRRSEEARPAKALQAARPESQWKGKSQKFFSLLVIMVSHADLCSWVR